MSCSNKNYKSIDNWNTIFDHAYNNYHNKQDSIYKIDENGIMCMYIRAYINSYFKQPKDIEELLHAFDKVEYIEDMKEMYGLQYQLMERYKDDIKVFAGDSVTALFYKRIIPENVIVVTGVTEVGRSLGHGVGGGFLSIKYSYFDKDGYLVENPAITDSLRKEYYIGIARKYYKYEDWKPSSIDTLYKEYIYVEYTPKVFRNIETGKPIPVNKWAYFDELREWMETTCNKYGFYRMIIPCLIPNDF